SRLLTTWVRCEPRSDVHSLGSMALHAAARNGDMPALQAAIASGADLNARDNLRRTPLILASWAGQVAVVKLLLAHGCDWSLAAADDMNALHFAAQKGQTEVVRLLLNAGLSVDGRNRKGSTALAMAAQQGHLETVQLLLARKASPRAANGKGQTPQDVTKSEAVLEVLKAASAAVAAAAEPGATDKVTGGVKVAQKRNRRGMRTAKDSAEAQPGDDGTEEATLVGCPERPPSFTALPTQADGMQARAEEPRGEPAPDEPTAAEVTVAGRNGDETHGDGSKSGTLPQVVQPAATNPESGSTEPGLAAELVHAEDAVAGAILHEPKLGTQEDSEPQQQRNVPEAKKQKLEEEMAAVAWERYMCVRQLMVFFGITARQANCQGLESNAEHAAHWGEQVAPARAVLVA
ncbi:hypothetical protein QJQ45_013742, partial [Haematococcus lacustris]